MVRASNHALLARSSSTTASVSHSQRRREEVLMRSRRIKTVASDPSPNELGVNRCPLETRGKRAARGEGRPRFAGTGSGRKERQLPAALDRKSTRLNSSHGYISYAVFCLKKKKT